jgi:hypothetical protein
LFIGEALHHSEKLSRDDAVLRGPTQPRQFSDHIELTYRQVAIITIEVDHVAPLTRRLTL